MCIVSRKKKGVVNYVLTFLLQTATEAAEGPPLLLVGGPCPRSLALSQYRNAAKPLAPGCSQPYQKPSRWDTDIHKGLERIFTEVQVFYFYSLEEIHTLRRKKEQVSYFPPNT